MGRVFDRTRVLLMPSIWEEPFGRLPVEAGACGIPTLASARGGLPESVGDGGILIDRGGRRRRGGSACLQQLDDRQAVRVAVRSRPETRGHARSRGHDAAIRRSRPTRSGSGSGDGAVSVVPRPTLASLPTPPRGRSGWPWTIESATLPPVRPDGSPWPRVSIVTPEPEPGPVHRRDDPLGPASGLSALRVPDC